MDRKNIGHVSKFQNEFWSASKESAFTSLSCSEKGLTADEAHARLEQFGKNAFQESSTTSEITLFFSQFKNPITLLLILASILSLGLGDRTDAIIIIIIILISSVLGFWQERGAAKAVKELLKMVQITSRAIRDGKACEVSVAGIVPGDIIILSAGDIVPGDSLVLESKELYVDEAAFTGETFPVEKDPGVLTSDTPMPNRSNSLFMGSHVISGSAKALVIKTGKQTEFGKISDRLRTATPETDFEKGIRHFGYMLMEITLILVLAIFAINILLHKPALDSFLFSLALAVGLTPQLLPAIISVNLSVGARAMAKEKVIVKRLSSIENFGSMNILCSDKTGTITEGKVTLKDALDVEGKHSEKTRQFAWLNASLQQGFRNPIDTCIQAGVHDNLEGFSVQSEIPYDFIRKRLTVQVKKDNQNFAITKGALNSVLSICNAFETSEGKTSPIQDRLVEIRTEYTRLSTQGLRVLGVAYKLSTSERDFRKEDEREMVFLGFITLFDPPKENVQKTISNLRSMGVQLKLITGDNALVASSLAKQIGITDPVILTGSQIREMSDRALVQQALTADIFAEVEPNQKERIVVFLKKSGNVVGFMGDGINDAPALHAADVGISVDSAVDVAKEAADIVLLSSDLNVLITGIIAGRKTFANTMKYIFMATSANFGNMFSMAGASLFLPFLPLLPKQVLLTNLLTDFPEMTIATDHVDSSAVSKPHKWDIKFIQRFMILFGLLSSFFDFITFGVLLFFIKGDEKLFQTGWFVESVISAALIVLVVRSRMVFFKSLPGKYLFLATLGIVAMVLVLPWLPAGSLFGFVRLPLAFYGWMLLIVAAYLLSAEMAKRWFYKRVKNQQA